MPLNAALLMTSDWKLFNPRSDAFARSCGKVPVIARCMVSTLIAAAVQFILITHLRIMRFFERSHAKSK